MCYLNTRFQFSPRYKHVIYSTTQFLNHHPLNRFECQFLLVFYLFSEKITCSSSNNILLKFSFLQCYLYGKYYYLILRKKEKFKYLCVRYIESSSIRFSNLRVAIHHTVLCIFLKVPFL